MVISKSNESNKAFVAGNILHFTSELQQFDFSNEAVDVALRKLLAQVPLPKESQLIDQAMEDFAKRYHQCNSTLADSYVSIYAMAFSILLLHTDAHNKNVKRKMNKDTFIMRTKLIEGGETVFSEVLDVTYDNIIHSEFSYADDQQIKSSWFPKKSSQPNNTLLHDLYPKLEHLMPATNNFSYKYAPKSTINITNIQQCVEDASTVLLTGVQSRQQHQQQTNGNETFLARVCKAEVVERKYDLVHGGRRSLARGWRPFGMILTGSQIMFFGDLVPFQSWLDSQQQLMDNNSNSTPSTHKTQLDQHQSSYLSIAAPYNGGTHPSMTSLNTFNSDRPVTTPRASNLTILSSSTSPMNSTYSSPSNDTFLTASDSTACLRPIQIVSLSNAICVYDGSYQKYPHVFRLITDYGQQFLIRCDGADDVDDWIQKINYVSAMKTIGIKLHPKTTASMPIGNHVYQHHFHSQQQLLGDSPYQHHTHHDGYAIPPWMKREQKVKAAAASFKEQIEKQQRQLEKDEQLRNQLMVLAPIQKSTKGRLLFFADLAGKRLTHDRIVLERLECYLEIVGRELVYYKSFKYDRQRFGNNGGQSKRSGQAGNSSSKMLVPLPFYSRLSHSRQPATSIQQQRDHATDHNHLLSPSLEKTTINNGCSEKDGKYAGMQIPRRSTSLLVSLSRDDSSKNKHKDNLKTTTTNEKARYESEKLEVPMPSIENQRQSCPHLNLVFNSHDDDHQQGSATMEADTVCENYHDGLYCRNHQLPPIKDSVSRQGRNQGNPFLTTLHSSDGDGDIHGGINDLQLPSLHISNGNKKLNDP